MPPQNDWTGRGHKAKADIIELLKRNPEQDRAEITRTIKRYRLRGSITSP
jgi:hypothetical protein